MKKYNPVILMIYGSVFGVMFGWTQYVFQHLGSGFVNTGNSNIPFSDILKDGTIPCLLIGAGAGLALCLLWNLELTAKFERYSLDTKACQRAMRKGNIDGTRAIKMLQNLGGSILAWLLGGLALAVVVSIVCAIGGIKEGMQTIMMKWCWLTSAAIPLSVSAVGMRRDHIFACAQAAIGAARDRETKEREQEAFVQRTRDYLNSSFSHTGKPLFYLQEILQYIEANSADPTYRKAVLSEICNHEATIYDDFLTLLSEKDFETAAKGLQLLRDACPEKAEYRRALDRLRNKKKLLAVMEQNGLTKSSPLMKRFSDIFD